MEGLTACLPEHHLVFPGVDQDNVGWCSMLQFISLGTKLLLFFYSAQKLRVPLYLSFLQNFCIQMGP
jgi:hypothetical protein